MQFDLESSRLILERTPRLLRSWLGDLPEPWIHCNEGPETWSPFDVVGHLIHGERTDWIPRARTILELGDSVVFEPFDRFAQFEASRERSLNELLNTFAKLRAENLNVLDEMKLTPRLLSLKGRHPEFGTVTLRQLLATWAAHDLGHIAQIARVMAKRHTHTVGPWRAYLGVLRD